MDSQTKAFQALKPICVALGNTAKRLGEGKAKASEVAEHLEHLKRTLETNSSKPGALHPKLAEYVFFPISQVLRLSQKSSIRCLELALQCIAVLVEHGWGDQLPPQTAAQLVILCTLLASRKPSGLPFEEGTEELQTSAFQCLNHIFVAAGGNDKIRSGLTAESQFPQLGQFISVALDAISNPDRKRSQAAAAAALEVLLTRLADREIHASFLPGILSKLTKTLTPSSQGRTSPQVMVQCLTIVTLLLRSTLGKPSEPLSSDREHSGNGSRPSTTSVIDSTWKANAATQLQPALTSIMRQKAHGNQDVRESLGRLCLTLLRDCGQTLSNCCRMALETLLSICARDIGSGVSVEFEMLLNASQSTSASLQELLYDWLRSLPTTMQGADEQVKIARIQQISEASRLLSETAATMPSIHQVAATALRDSVMITIAAPDSKGQALSIANPLQTLDLAALRDSGSRLSFGSPLVRHVGQRRLLENIEGLALQVAGNNSGLDLRRSLMRSLHHSKGDASIADFWLLLTASERSWQSQEEEVSFLNLPSEGSSALSEELDALYSLALTLLTSEDGNGNSQDPRLLSLALRALALRARSAGEDFRFELLDALYPVLHTLATPDEMLQRASITTLNILTSACGYASVKDLIVENVDYLVNAVALKLNAFDVSPQAPQVLLMMVKLAGPSLLPYLEDTVESIFAALEDYHGYPLLVELLFKVLSVMAEEGVKTPKLAIEEGMSVRHDDCEDRWAPTAILGLATQLRLRAQDEALPREVDHGEKEKHPQRPWGETPATDSAEADDVETTQDQSLDSPESTPPAPRTYSLLLKVTELTQHFLPSASPSLRTSLLGLIRTTAPALAKHENSFLPLVNSLWPEIVARLDDDEIHITATALDIVRVLCEAAGDFMRSRIVQLWPRLVEIRQVTAKSLVQENYGDRLASTHPTTRDQRLRQALIRMEKNPSVGTDTNMQLLWESLQNLIASIVQHVHMPPEYVDQALEMASPSLGRQAVRSAFEKENSDALWLESVKIGLVDRPDPVFAPAGSRWRFAAVPG